MTEIKVIWVDPDGGESKPGVVRKLPDPGSEVVFVNLDDGGEAEVFRHELVGLPPTGWEKADRAAAALQTYHEETDGPWASYGDEGSQEFVDAIEDLLVDLRHLTSRAGVSFPELDEAASARWCEQVEEDDNDD